ncbi:MAG: hypothetical protein NC318_07130 [Blautia sp.]|nr:hypothetical protein [Lachnoclostridium sp.]MCM1211359.1 hypothetical protein [Blautia sp.]
MLQVFLKHPEFMIPILTLLLLSIICQISIGVLYHKLILETENMSTTTNKSLQQLKLKFSSCCKLHDGISNVPVFVDKYMNQIKIYGIPLSALRHLSGQLALLSILVSGVGAYQGIIGEEPMLYIAPYYIVSFLGLYCYFAISSLVDISDSAKVLRTNLIDYLENHLSNRLEQTSLDLKLVQGEPADKPDMDTEMSADDAQEKQPEGTILSRTEAQELESLLKEFLA